MTALSLDFCGESHQLDPRRPFTIGREGDLVVDDNPYLHRAFLTLQCHEGLWWLVNTGSALTATVADADGLLQAWLAPGARLPVVFPETRVWFTAGPTTYELDLLLPGASFVPTLVHEESREGTTVGRTSFTPDQRLLVLSLAEPLLRRGERGNGHIPSNSEAARRLGWAQTRFNRKLDNVCQKLVKQGVRGLHGDAGNLATQRRARLVEYVVSTRLVTRADLELLDAHLRSLQGDSSPSTSPPPADTLAHDRNDHGESHAGQA